MEINVRRMQIRSPSSTLIGEIDASTAAAAQAQILPLRGLGRQTAARHDAGDVHVQRRPALLLSIYRRISDHGGRSCWSASRGHARHHVDDRFLGFLRHPRHGRGRAGDAERLAFAREPRRHRMERIDARPTHTHGGYQLRVGRPFPFGATLVPGGVNFSVFSEPRHRLHPGALRQGPIPSERRDPVPEGVPHRQCLRHDRLRPRLREHRVRLSAWTVRGHRSRVIASTQRRSCSTRTPRRSAGATSGGAARTGTTSIPHRGRLVLDDFDWEGDRPLEMPIEDLVIYEMHVRGFTAHPSVRRQVPGHVRRHAREDPVPEGAGHQLRRADADLRVRRVREQPAPTRTPASC